MTHTGHSHAVQFLSAKSISQPRLPFLMCMCFMRIDSWFILEERGGVLEARQDLRVKTNSLEPLSLTHPNLKVREEISFPPYAIFNVSPPAHLLFLSSKAQLTVLFCFPPALLSTALVRSSQEETTACLL